MVLFALGSLILLLPVEVREFALGAWVAGWAATFWHWIDVGSGAANIAMGDQGEQWTLSEIRQLHRQGWRIVNGLRLGEHGDIDTLLVGAPGLVVVETKWSAAGWSDHVRRNAIERAIRQVRSHQRMLHSKLAAREPVPVHAGVALWPHRDAPSRHSRGKVEVMPGGEIRAWIDGLPPAPNFVPDSLWSLVDQELLTADTELRVGEPVPQSLESRLLGFAQYPIAIYLAVLFVAFAASIGGLALMVTLTAIGAVVGALLSQSDLARGFGLSFALTTVGVTLGAVSLEIYHRIAA